MTHRDAALVVMLALAACSPANGGAESANHAPAKVIPASAAGAAARIELAPEAEERLGVTTAPVEIQTLPRTRTYGGEVVLPPGRSLVLTAPFAGTLRAAQGAELVLGAPQARGATLIELVPLLSPEHDVQTSAERVQTAQVKTELELARVQTRGDLAAAEARLAAAQVALERAEELVQRQAGSLRARDDARAEHAMAKALVDAHTAKLESLAAIRWDEPGGAATALAITAPLAGSLVAVHATPGQVVAAGAPLLEVAALERVWIRVPVYVGELATIEPASAARIGSLSETPGEELLAARPVAAPPSANAATASADLWYELENPPGARALRPGQRVGATLTLVGAEESTVVPWSAILHDAQASTWVYVQVAEHAYERRRVEVERVSGDVAVLARGPEVGTAVVVTAATELFGTEFGSAGKK